jgi:hypothetical protein
MSLKQENEGLNALLHDSLQKNRKLSEQIKETNKKMTLIEKFL